MRATERNATRTIALLLCAAMFLCLLPVNTSATPSSALIITVQSSTGEPLTEAIVIVTDGFESRKAVNNGDGTYLHEKNNSNTASLSVHIACDGYYAKIETAAVDTTAKTVTLDACSTAESDWVEFGVFYTADGKLPNQYCAPGSSQGNYGPSGNGTSLVQIKVDINRLKTYDAVIRKDNVEYNNTTSNAFEFSPATTSSADEAKLVECNAFWTAVKQCMDFESEQAFRSTGLYDVFIAYSLKKEVQQILWWSTETFHLDGILNAEPPVYVIEMLYDGNYFGGFVTDMRTQNPTFPTMDAVLQAYEDHLNQTISWTNNSDGTYSGSFVSKKTLYKVTVNQTNSEKIYPDGSKIGYTEEGTDYYVAIFDLTVDSTQQVQFTVTYTDGLTWETVFTDQVQTAESGDSVAPFTGNTDREGYVFQGWILEGGNGSILTDTQVQAMVVTEQDMVFVASYLPKSLSCTVTFYANNTNYTGEDIFRVCHLANNEDNTISVFYDIPQFDYETHNNYIFKGWYLDEDNENDSRPIDWYACYTENTNIYAHWIYVDTAIAQENDSKLGIPDSTYHGYDLAGTQIRYAQADPEEHYGDTGAGLRFITAISENVWMQLQALDASTEYGVVMAKAETAKKYRETYAPNDEDYQLQYVANGINGIDTTESYKYAKNIKCSGLPTDHFNGEKYRLYTAVLTYQGREEGDPLFDTQFLSRSYIRYKDANGLPRVYYNIYTEATQLYHSCAASYNEVIALTEKALGGNT